MRVPKCATEYKDSKYSINGGHTTVSRIDGQKELFGLHKHTVALKKFITGNSITSHPYWELRANQQEVTDGQTNAW